MMQEVGTTLAWTEARLRPAGESVRLADGRPGYALEAIPGADYKLDRSRLTLAIAAPAAAFDSTVLALSGKGASPATTPPGFYLNYDLSATRAQDTQTSYGAIVEGVAFSRWGAFVTSGALRHDFGPLTSVRLDTYWRTDFPERMESLVIGDTIGSGGVWSRPVRFGGVRYARDQRAQNQRRLHPEIFIVNCDAANSRTAEIESTPIFYSSQAISCAIHIMYISFGNAVYIRFREGGLQPKEAWCVVCRR